MTDEITTLFTMGLGPWLIPLRGKIPVLDAWQDLPPTTEPQVREWREIGYNLGFRTGARSGLVVIDDDQPKHGGGSYTPPPTGLVAESPTGGRHYYYTAPDPCPGNSASKLAPHVDVRGTGGQVVVAPSVHPNVRRPYRWVSTGKPGAFPATVQVDLTKPAPPKGIGYAQTALVREAASVRAAAEGGRNDALNRATYSLGQLVAGGALSEAEVVSELTQAALIAGLDEPEIAVTIRSALKAGAKAPRSAPVATATASPNRHAPPDILVPGSHQHPERGYVEQGQHTFAHLVLSKVDPGSLYRRAGQLGEIEDGAFTPASVHRLRTIIDESVRLTASKTTKDDEPTIVYRTCTRDQADVVLSYGRTRGPVRVLRYIASHPICLGPEFVPGRPGWNEDDGAYLACAEVPEPLPVAEARAVLEDLVADFPFQEAADRANFFGLLLTPILRPAINEPVPMHLVNSPMERTGKTKLAEIVLGVSVAGVRLPAMQLGDREEEIEKRILSVLLRGQNLLHLDNLGEYLNSASLASLITASEYQGRLLGSSVAPTIPNGLTVVGTGNNVHATGELAKRIVPIRLMPASEAPEDRTDFRHPDLLGYCFKQRQRVLGALLGLVAEWRARGRPLHPIGFGGFERWAAVTGGILTAAGYDEWLTNLQAWRGAADDDTQEHRALVQAWHDTHGLGWTQASQVYDLAVSLDLYGWLDSAKTDRARRRVFGTRVLNRLSGRVVSIAGHPVRIESTGTGSRRRVKLTPID